MTFNPAVPLSSDSPSIFPSQSQGNYTRLQTLFGADHQFNLSATANDGFHNLVHLNQQSPASTSLPTIGRLYGKMSAGTTARVHEFYMDSVGTEYQVTPSMPIRAAVNFSVVTTVVTVNTNYNAPTVVRVSQGIYTITFTNPMPDTFYIPQVTGLPSGSSYIIGMATTLTTANITIKFMGANGAVPALVDPPVAFLTIFSTT